MLACHVKYKILVPSPQKKWETTELLLPNTTFIFFIIIAFDHSEAFNTTDYNNLNPLFEGQSSLDFCDVSSLYFHSSGHSILAFP